jgi:hypothetical protein
VRALGVLRRGEPVAVEQPGRQPVGSGQDEQEAGHPGEPDVRDPAGPVDRGEQRQHPPARGPRSGRSLVVPVEHERGDTGADPGRAPGAPGDAIAPADDVGELRPPPVGDVEPAGRHLVADGEDLHRPAGGPSHHHRAHARHPRVLARARGRAPWWCRPARSLRLAAGGTPASPPGGQHQQLPVRAARRGVAPGLLGELAGGDDGRGFVPVAWRSFGHRPAFRAESAAVAEGRRAGMGRIGPGATGSP